MLSSWSFGMEKLSAFLVKMEAAHFSETLLPDNVVSHFKRSQDSSVSIVKGYDLDGRGSIPGRGKIFLSSTVSRPALGPTQPPIQWVPGGLSLGIKQQGCEADHYPI
jgi:hypothetical protein